MDGPAGSVAREQRDALIEKFQRYVEVVVHKLIRNMGLPVARRDDLISAGMIGLVEAASRYQPENNDTFESYSYLRIRGAIIDAIRRDCDLKPGAYKRAQAFLVANELRLEEFNRVENSVGAESAANHLESLMDYASKAVMVHRLSVEDAEIELNEVQEPTPTPEESLSERQQVQKLREIVATLPEKERLVIEQLYFKDVSLSDIATEHAEYSKSWISRLHDKALVELRSRLISARCVRDSREAEAAIAESAVPKRPRGRPRKHESRVSGINSNEPIRKRGKSRPRPARDSRI